MKPCWCTISSSKLGLWDLSSLVSGWTKPHWKRLRLDWYVAGNKRASHRRRYGCITVARLVLARPSALEAVSHGARILALIHECIHLSDWRLGTQELKP